VSGGKERESARGLLRTNALKERSLLERDEIRRDD
jgi:hypothetical protein